MRYVFFNDTATTEIYTLSLHDALPFWRGGGGGRQGWEMGEERVGRVGRGGGEGRQGGEMGRWGVSKEGRSR